MPHLGKNRQNVSAFSAFSAFSAVNYYFYSFSNIFLSNLSPLADLDVSFQPTRKAGKNEADDEIDGSDK